MADRAGDDVRVTLIGEALVDLVDQGTTPIDDEGGAARPFLGHPGGSPLNVSVGVARLGVPASFLGRTGHDAFGRIVRAHLARNGVDLSGLVDAPELSTLAVVSIDARYQATYDFYVEGTADWGWTPAELATLPTGTAVVHTGSIASWTAPGDAVIADCLARARADGLLTSYDPNVRPALMPADPVGKVESLVRQARLVKASEDDLAFLYPGVATAEVARAWLGLGPDLVVVTRGEHGAVATSAAGAVEVEGLRVDVVDTVGAGDAFMAGLLAGTVDRGAVAPEAFSALAADLGAVEGLLRHAMVVAAITCGRAGADPPTAADLAAFAGPGA